MTLLNGNKTGKQLSNPDCTNRSCQSGTTASQEKSGFISHHFAHKSTLVSRKKLEQSYYRLVFVCLSLLEAAFISYISNLNEQTDKRAGSFSCPSWNNNDKMMDVELNNPSNKCGQKIRAERIHKFSRVIFPVLFIFFNIGYFLYYFYM